MNFDELIPAAPQSAPQAAKIRYVAPAAPAIPQYTRIKVNPDGTFVRINNKGCKSKIAAIILAVLTGFFGGHDFYLGRKKYGIIKLCTCFLGVSIVWSIIDIVLLATNKMKLETAEII